MSKIKEEQYLVSKDYQYLKGFGNYFETEALDGALPKDQNSPQVCSYGLYAEQLTGTAFTAPRCKNQKSWLYRIKPSVCHKPYKPYSKVNKYLKASFFSEEDHTTPQQLRWMPLEFPKNEKLNFVNGIRTICGSGGASIRTGMAIHQYLCNTSMTKNEAFLNSDGDFLIVPQQGILAIQTEFGWLKVEPTEICVIPRGIKFRVELVQQDHGDDKNEEKKKNNEVEVVPVMECRGYIAELFLGQLILPDLGPIGSNGLANPRDFLYPEACYEDRNCDEFELIHKFNGKLFSAIHDHSVFNVVAWHGNYAPYKYDLKKFNTMNSVSYDHPDPSIYTVLTCPSTVPGTAILDFVIFPPRWMAMENSFRPPYYHRNIMTEYMGLITGKYDAKEKGFVPGGSSLHSCMVAHGPDKDVFYNSSNEDTTKPYKFNGGLAFMFETMFMLNPTEFALDEKNIDVDYYKCWELKKYFNPEEKKVKIDKQ